MLNTKLLSGTAAAPKEYVEDVFSTYLYTGNGSTQTITNGIDLAGKSGLVWIKSRSAATDHQLFDTARGATKELISNSTAAEATDADTLTAFNADGFSLDADSNTNTNAATYCSWSFRKAFKFFDVVTYTGNGSNRTIAHNLGSVPGMIIVKRTDTTADWQVYHRSLANTEYLVLNTTAAKATGATRWNSTTPTSSVFSLGTDATVNASGGTYVAYLFAHDAGGFGAVGTDNIISCGSFTTNASELATVNLGYEPQFILTKKIDSISDWYLLDSMRGNTVINSSIGGQNILYPNSNIEENASYGQGYPMATGFQVILGGVDTSHIYIAIRRPMKTPTSGTQVFGLNARTGTGANATVTGGQIDDAVLIKNRGSAVFSLFSSRLTGTGRLITSATTAETAADTSILQATPWDVMDGVKVGTTSTATNASGVNYINYLFRRSPEFFDVVCYTGTGSATTQAHNLGVAPELMIVKRRNTANAWAVYANNDNTDYLVLNTTAATVDDNTYWNDTSPTSTVFSVGTNAAVNASGSTYVAYLFATLAGVSKVGSYTGNGSNQTINCGFTAGARFVLIKRTDSTGNWWVFDTARGIVSGNDPYLFINSTAAEVTTRDAVDPDNSGFIVNNDATNFPINVNAATYIFLAIA
jgi:hypothetical protein